MAERNSNRVMTLDVGTILVGSNSSLRAVVLHIDRARGQVTLRRADCKAGDWTLSLSALEQGHTGWTLAPTAGEGGGA